MNPLFAQIPWDETIFLVKQYGPLVVVTGVILWQSWLRELRMAKRINKLEDEHGKVLIPLVKQCSEVITANTSMMARLEQALNCQAFCRYRGDPEGDR